MTTSLSINDLDPTQVAAAETYLASFLQEEYPSMDLTPGRVLRELLIRPAALFHVLNQTNMDRLRQSMSMLAIEADPTLADADTVDAVLSNYRITRQAGTAASGYVSLIISDLLTTAVPAGTVFTSNGLNYVTQQAYIGVTSAAAVVTEQERLITRRTDGYYSFTVPVTAEAAGDQYNAKLGARFTLAPTVSGLIDAVAAADFSPGVAEETNAELVQRFKEALSPQTMAGRIHIQSLLRTPVPNFLDLSIIGFGDTEMLRDRHNIFEVSTGGKADLYLRSTTLPLETVLTKSAVLIDKTNKLWQTELNRGEAPGFYEVLAITAVNAADAAASYELTEETRGLDLTPPNVGDFVPDLANLTEGAYTRYQTAVIKFSVPDVDVTTLTELSSTQDFKVRILVLPDIATAQDFVNDRGRRNPQADYLVRAPIPALLGVTMQVNYTDDDETPNAAAIRQAVAAKVNALTFAAGRVDASVIHTAAQSVLNGPDVHVVSPLDLLCVIRKPAGTTLTLRSANSIVIPDLPEEGVSPRNTCFYLDEAGVDVTIQKVSKKEV